MNQPMKCRKRRDEIKTGEESLTLDRVLDRACQEIKPVVLGGLRHRGGRTLIEAGIRNVGIQEVGWQEKSHKLKNSEGETIEADLGDGVTRSSDDPHGNMERAKGLPLSTGALESTFRTERRNSR